MTEPRPMMLPGLKTALQPISQPSPSNAPNLRNPVSNGAPSIYTATVPPNKVKLEIFTPAPKWAL